MVRFPQPARGLSWTRESTANGTCLAFSGEVNEHFSGNALIDEMRELQPGPVTLDCAGIRRLNSEGIRRWVNFLRDLGSLEEVTEIVYTRCSVAIVTQINMIPAMLEHAEVMSLYAPYVCEDTDEEQDRLIQVSDLRDPNAPPTYPHESGDGVWELDEDPTRYFAFLLDQVKHVPGAAPGATC